MKTETITTKTSAGEAFSFNAKAENGRITSDYPIKDVEIRNEAATVACFTKLEAEKNFNRKAPHTTIYVKLTPESIENLRVLKIEAENQKNEILENSVITKMEYLVGCDVADSISFDYNNEFVSKIIFTENKLFKEMMSMQDACKKAFNILKDDLVYKTEGPTNFSYCTYVITGTSLQKVIELAEKNIKEAANKKNSIKKQSDKKISNIENGAIYFVCESEPHNEDLSKVILARPCPQSGVYAIDHRISQELFSRIKEFGRYWSAEFLEDCDMFAATAGWKFGKQAIEELVKTQKVFVNGTEVKK